MWNIEPTSPKGKKVWSNKTDLCGSQKLGALVHSLPE